MIKMNFSIIGTGSALPGTCQSNEVISKLVDTSDEWIRERTGIRGRHILTKAKLSDIATRAALKAVADAGIDPKELDMIICTTVRGDFATPALACIIQKEIGAECPAFDMNAGCCGFLVGLDVAEAYFAGGKVKKMLIVSAEAMSRCMDWNDRSTCVLFGDGAGAVVLEQGDSLMAIKLTTHGNADYLRIANSFGNCPIDESYLTEENPDAGTVSEIGRQLDYNPDGTPYEYLKMEGQEVYKFAVSSMCREIPLTLEMAGVAKDDVALVLPHQANMRIINGARVRLKIPKEKFRTNLEYCGNTSSASIPLLLDELNKKGELHKDDILLLSAFGAGLTTATCVLKWTK